MFTRPFTYSVKLESPPWLNHPFISCFPNLDTHIPQISNSEISYWSVKKGYNYKAGEFFVGVCHAFFLGGGVLEGLLATSGTEVTSYIHDIYPQYF